MTSGWAGCLAVPEGRYVSTLSVCLARAWHDRFVIRDIIDLHAVAGAFSYADLEALGLPS